MIRRRCRTPVFHRTLAAGLLLILTVLGARPVQANTLSPWSQADAVRQALLRAQLALLETNQTGARSALDDATTQYQPFASRLQQHAPEAATAVGTAMTRAEAAVDHRDALALAAARGTVWTSLLRAGYDASLAALRRSDMPTARDWLLLREFRPSTRVAATGVATTRALDAALRGDLQPADVAKIAQADLLDTYQYQMQAALTSADESAASGRVSRRAEQAALAAGYFQIVHDAYAAQHTAADTTALLAAFGRLTTAAQTQDESVFRASRTDVASLLEGFRAVPLTDAERGNRANKVARYLALVAPNYGRGVRNGQISSQVEVDEARTFRKAAEDAFHDLAPILKARDAARTTVFQTQLTSVTPLIDVVAPPEQVQAATDAAARTWQELVPADWLQTNPSADFDAIREVLTQIERAVSAGQYPQAESARLEAYAILDAGPEIRLRGLAPDLAAELSGLFWQGHNGRAGLAVLIADQASIGAVQQTNTDISTALTRAQSIVGSGNATTGSAIGNAAIIIFRQGLEAVVILASILAGLRKPGDQHYRRPLVWGAVLSGFATLITWFALRGLLNRFAQFGERLEAIVSLIAVAVLLLILNWFFHKIYWVGWLSHIHSQKKRGILSAEAGQFIALLLVGFSSVYREGFETVLFSQVLVLEVGPGAVIQGLLLGAIPVLIVGLITFRLQAKLPYRQLLIVTGVLIGTVLLQMVGQTVHVMQSVRWMPVTPVSWLPVPYWMGVWFGVFPTWQGMLAQGAAAAFVIGSYVLAERQNHQKRNRLAGRTESEARA